MCSTIVIKSCDHHVIHTTHDDGNMNIMYRSTTNIIWIPPIHHCSIIHSTHHSTNVYITGCIPQTFILYNTTHLISYDNWSVDEHTTDYTMYMYSQVILHLLNPLPLYHSNNTHAHVTVYVFILFPLTLLLSSGGTDTPAEGGVVCNTIHNDIK